MIRARHLLVSLVAVGALIACAPPPSAPNGLVGDSISWHLGETGGVPGYGLIDASRGRTTYSGGFSGEPGSGLEGTARVGKLVRPGDWVVIELGTNDVAVEARTDTYVFRIQQLLDAVPKDRCVAFVTVRRRNYVDRSNVWNAQVRSRIVDHPCRAIIDWDLAVRQRPGLLGSDGIHPSAAGEAWLRNQLVYVAGL